MQLTSGTAYRLVLLSSRTRKEKNFLVSLHAVSGCFFQMLCFRVTYQVFLQYEGTTRSVLNTPLNPVPSII